MDNKKKLITAIVFLVLVASIIAGVLLVRENQNISEKAAPATNLTFSPVSVALIKGQTFTTNSRINTGTNLVTGIDIEISYNPAIIQLSQITPTSSLSIFTNAATGQVIKNEINNTNGTARFIAFVLDKNSGITGQKDILAISGTVMANAQPATYQITYSATTSIAAMNESQNSLLSKSAFSLNVTNPTPTPSPSPTATPTKSPSPTPTPTKSPSPTPTPTKSPTATPTKSPSPSPSPIAYPDWDVDQSGTTNIIDIGLVVDDYGNPNPITPRADVDKNGTINIIDIGIIVDHYQ